ncbi:glycosyltransferase family 4 protein [Sphingomonas baiyangensis]|uniref:Glycosyltransferase family 4 protein n=1 Tax=Sphingomonas baiyangensis TaxID=2572576 RepID=A0A4V5PWR1_9SPHN|nr:glycosyltransferase family 4 protein [Sphingomonas baiyangensis]
MTRRVIVIATALPRWISDFAEVSTALAAAGHRVELWFPRDNGLPGAGWDGKQAIDAARATLPLGVSTRSLPFTRNRGPLSIAKLTLASLICARAACRERDGLFILWSALSVIIAGPWVRLFGRRGMYLITGLGAAFSARQRNSFVTKLICLVYRYAFSSDRAIVIVHNHEDKAELVAHAGVMPERVIVTGGCGVRPEDFSYRAALSHPPRPTILVPGRLLRDKGVMEAAQASGILSGRGVAHRMIFTSNAMSGRDDALNADELARAAAHPDVEFVGFQPDIAALYREADLVCIASWYREGLQTALLESAASGCPLVVCDNVGVRDFMRDDVEGLIVPPRDAAAIADALERLVREPETAERLRVAAYRRYRSGFTRDHMLDATLAGLRSIGVATASA